jgi:hypothetical protein
MIFDSLVYPVRDDGWMMIVAGALFSAILHFGGIWANLFLAGYFLAFYLDIVGSTMSDHDELPQWPGITDFHNDILSPFLRVCGVMLISFAPFAAVVFLAPKEEVWYSLAVLAMKILGYFYFPMAILAHLALGGIGAAMPHIVLPGIFRIFPSYFLGVVALAVAVGAVELAHEYASAVPYAGWALAPAVGIYGTMAMGRLLGLIYRRKREALGWA